MGNLFMGFPVPRAKIAEMIEGEAAPTLHIANHLPDGTDPLALPGDISAGQIVKWNGTKFIGIAEPSGGIATRYADTDHYLCTNFESLDGFYTSTSLTASITLNDEMVWLNTGTTINSIVSLKKQKAIWFPMPTWAKARKFRLTAYFYSNTDEYGLIYIGTGRALNKRHVAFLVEDGVLKGSVHNGSVQTKVTLDDWGSGAYAKFKELEAIFTPASKAEFYVAGVKVDEITTNLPGGSTDAAYWLFGYVKNTGHSKENWLRMSQFEMTQAQ